MRSVDPHLHDRDLIAKIDRELDPARLAAVECHLAACDQCRTRADQWLAATLALRREWRSRPDDDRHAIARQRLADALTRESERPTASVGGGWQHGWALRPVIALTAVIVAVVLVADRRHPAQGPDGLTARALPIARVTPGAVSSLTAAQLCGGERPSRVVAPAVARQVLREYDMERVPADEYELDALITPELGGTVAAANLWPQRYTGGAWTASVKDDIENWLHDAVCNGSIDLQVAQREIAADWIAAYRRHFHRGQPATIVRSRRSEPEVVIATHRVESAPRFAITLTSWTHTRP